LLLFASNGNGDDNNDRSSERMTSWRSVDCFDQTPIYDVRPADYFKARLCQKQNLANCSAASEIIVIEKGKSTTRSHIDEANKQQRRHDAFNISFQKNETPFPPED
uniref:CHHC U11-48K-type domain-containing protein n=1 Tax=Gongylonema pulchrum TaxID=637853 RepID=A0A183F0E9_9BILA